MRWPAHLNAAHAHETHPARKELPFKPTSFENFLRMWYVGFWNWKCPPMCRWARDWLVIGGPKLEDRASHRFRAVFTVVDAFGRSGKNRDYSFMHFAVSATSGQQKVLVETIRAKNRTEGYILRPMKWLARRDRTDDLSTLQLELETIDNVVEAVDDFDLDWLNFNRWGVGDRFRVYSCVIAHPSVRPCDASDKIQSVSADSEV